ncbi:hypothetical protein LTR96_007932 [Exophiala xenobiotica]|nr:hypothetical protein LTR72_001877 [Exophiala xenobiotica]KAK5266682.1 hypothetical protein LTR96_007932 [Exophiala xenobiotica]KAK5281127.1 hypothetical protein LTR40_005340 [Exophiala xenobiotica]KAK5417444.1 hypothetical protein LTR90_004618 [Exophiala xenobiotica]KAK5503461.1 hypothetical protein LTR83_001386 [Exophiala xenobiotica]
MFNFTGQTLTILITLTSSTAFFLFGYDQGVLSGIIGADNQFGHDFGHPDATAQGYIVSVYQLGCFAGSIAVFFLGDWLGRRPAILWASLFMLVGGILQTAAVNVPMLMVARIISGLGNGANTSTIPVWQSETSSAKDRGKLIAIDACIINSGVMVAYWVDYGFAKVTGPAQWRVPVGLQLIFIVMVIVLTFILPETPRYLMSQGRDQEAKEVMARLAGKNVTTDDHRVVELCEEIQAAIAIESAGGPFKMKELLQGGKLQNFRRMLICFAIQGFQQLGGICLITYYLPKVLVSSVGMSRAASLLVAGLCTTEYVLASIFQVFMVGWLKRRTMLFISSAGEITSMVVLAITVWHGGFGAGIVATIMLFGFNTFYSFGWLTVPFVYPAEITTLRLRAKGCAIASAGAWIIEFMVVQITPIAVQNIGYKTYIIFAVLNIALIVPVTYFFFPETAGLPLEAVDYIFEAGGITAGVFQKGGTVDRRRDIERNLEQKAHEHAPSTPPIAIEILEHPQK